MLEVLNGPSAALGALFGGTIVAFVQHLLKRRGEKHARDETEQRIIDSLRGEMKGVRDQLKLFRQLAQNLAIQIGDSDLLDPKTKVVSSQLRFAHEIATPIYDAVGPDIGRLWRKMARKTAEFYADVPASCRKNRSNSWFSPTVMGFPVPFGV